MSRTQQAMNKLPQASDLGAGQLAYQKKTAKKWFHELRGDICSSFENLERKAVQDFPHLYGNLPGNFTYTPWDREGGGGGEMGLMKGRLFEKVGVNISTVWGEFSPQFRAQIPGAMEDPAFWASGISLVAHMRNPHIPAVHMNTRFIVTQKQWFGGGMDLTPCMPLPEDTDFFHQTIQKTCDQHDTSLYPQYKSWCDEYFYLPHRQEPRGIGGIFFDYFNRGDWNQDFSFLKDVGKVFSQAFIPLVEKHMGTRWSAAEEKKLLDKRGRYVEFNLLYDRGTAFGLKTGGHTEAILMSMPPRVTWS